MAMRGSKVGDRVRVAPLAGKRRYGVIVDVDSQGVRTVATPEGHSYHVPDELNPTDHPVPAKAAEDLDPGDTVVLYTGDRRTVASVKRLRSGNLWLRFETVEGPHAPFAAVSSTADRLWVLADE